MFAHDACLILRPTVASCRRRPFLMIAVLCVLLFTAFPGCCSWGSSAKSSAAQNKAAAQSRSSASSSSADGSKQKTVNQWMKSGKRPEMFSER
jgi:hypothetical protein